MININLQVSGIPEVQQALRTFPEASKKAFLDVIRLSLIFLQRDAIKNAPVNTGALRNAIYTSIEPNALQGFVGVDTNRAPYAEAVEVGRKPGAAMPPLDNTGLQRWAAAKGSGATIGDPMSIFPLARKIKQAGIKAKPFLGTALQANEQRILLMFEEAANRILGNI